MNIASYFGQQLELKGKKECDIDRYVTTVCLSQTMQRKHNDTRAGKVPSDQRSTTSGTWMNNEG